MFHDAEALLVEEVGADDESEALWHQSFSSAQNPSGKTVDWCTVPHLWDCSVVRMYYVGDEKAMVFEVVAKRGSTAGCKLITSGREKAGRKSGHPRRRRAVEGSMFDKKGSEAACRREGQDCLSMKPFEAVSEPRVVCACLLPSQPLRWGPPSQCWISG